MEKQTILCTALPNGRAPDGSLRLSVYLSPRLWSDDVTVSKLALSQFPDLLSWPARIAAANWSVAFDGAAPVAAVVESAPPRADLWAALFKSDTDVVPFRFENHTDTAIESIDSATIHDLMSGIYVRAATDPSYGAGRDLPPAEILARDPDLSDIARPTQPESRPEPGPRPPPIDLGGRPPRPEPEPPRRPERPERPPDRPWCRCICWLLRCLARLFPRLDAWADRLCSPAQPDQRPPEETEPTSVPIPTKGMPPGSPPVVAPGPAVTPPVVVTPGPPAAKKLVFDELVAFLTPPPAGPSKLPKDAVELEELYDFHSMIATLGDYPKLLRLLGLVVDLRVEAAPAAAGTVKIVPAPGLTTATTLATPRTHYRLDDERFLAAPRPDDPEITNGLLRLSDAAQFRVIQVDVVGGGVKLQNAATNMMVVAKGEDRAPNMPDNSGLPALRTAGIAVIRRNIKDELQGVFANSAALQASVSAADGSPAPTAGGAPVDPSDELFAEDLVRGYRVDVFDSESGAWHSLCRRRGTYDFLAASGAPGGKISIDEEDEGFVQFSATTVPPPADALRTTDSLFVWDGWSLAAPRPGKTIMNDDQPDGNVTLEHPPNKADTKFKLEVNFKPKAGSLPRLRFEYQYRLRARICDLAGNSVFDPDAPAFAADAPEATPPFPCARYEPVSPPALMLRAEPIEGESLERLVVRSPPVGSEPALTERHVIPPKVSQLMAEQHGMFDAGAQMDGSLAAYDLAKREAGALTDGATEIAKGTPAVNTGIWVHAGAQYSVTYLPDPSARGAVLLGLPGLAPEEIVEPTAAKTVNKVPFAGTWPLLESFRLRLTAIAEGAAPVEPHWNALDRVLTVQLPQAEKKVVRINSYLSAADFAQRGVAHWTKNGEPAKFAAAEADAIAGRSWLHLPWRDITLVHAVQKPLAPTAITTLTPDKKLGQTFATLSGNVAPHAASTGKVDLFAQWEDPIDDPAQPAPGTRAFKAHICEVLVPEGSAAVSIPPDAAQPKPTHEFGDTKFHDVAYTTVATTRFREYFPTSVTNVAANITLENPTGTQRAVLNSARPDAPRVLYVVPIYEWQESTAGAGKTTRVRKGGGLRVYLERPWYSSGANELLGVVFLPDAKFLSLALPLKTLVTHWGADPMWRSAAAADNARMENFTGFVAKDDGLSLAENPQTVSVAGYPVEFDAARRLWFADIGLDVGPNYAPFVRLALARFQPHSVPDAHLSRIVRADFAQFAADRSASYTVNANASGAKVEITVKGPTYIASDAMHIISQLPNLLGKDQTGLAEIEARLQTRNPAFGVETELGWETLATERLLQDPSQPGLWQGVVNFTGALTPAQSRILLLEYEWHRADVQAGEKSDVALTRRVVYADTIRLA